jgi:hypothetical protein
MIKVLLACLLAPALQAAAAEPPLELTGYVSAWTQSCAGSSCALPSPGQRNFPLALILALPSEPGQAAAAHVSAPLLLPGGGEITAEITLFGVCPYGSAPGTCAGRYFQAQVLLTGPAGAFCSASLNLQDFAPFPVLMCAGTSPERRFGITLHRKAL